MITVHLFQTLPFYPPWDQVVIILPTLIRRSYYALFVAIIAIVFGYIPAGLGIPWYIDIPVAVVVMYLGLRILGEKVEFDVEGEAA